MQSMIPPDLFARSVRRRMWRHSALIALVVFLVFLVYIYLQKRDVTVALVNEALASTGSVMIGLSFAMSGFCYYFDFLDNKIAYRKYFGLVGFWLAFVYAAGLAWLYPEKYVYGLGANFFTPDLILGLTALEIFAFMTVISTHWAMKRMGIVNWRRGMRLGYVAYSLLILRAVIVEGGLWLAWWVAPVALPPLRLVSSVFALIVLLFRGSMIVTQRFAKPTPRKLQLDHASL